MELKPHQFYALHQLLILKAFGTEEAVAERNNSQLYGLNNYEGDPGTLGGKMQKVLRESVYAKALYDRKQWYNRQLERFGPHFSLKIPPKNMDQYLRYLGAGSPNELPELVAAYYATKEVSQEAFILPQIEVAFKKDDGSPEGDGMALLPRPSFHPNIKNISRTQNWWLYFYEYLHSNEALDKKYLIRILVKIKKLDDNYVVEYLNSNPKYTDYFGHVQSISSKEMVIQLQGGDPPKRQYLLFNVEAKGNKPLYIGIYTKHDDIGRIYSGSAILHRIPDSMADPKTEVFEYGKASIRQVPQAIQDFFYQKHYNYLKTPKIYDLEGLGRWMHHKKEQRGEIPKYDVFLAAPILALKRKSASVREALQQIESAIKVEHGTSSPHLSQSIADALTRMGVGTGAGALNAFDYTHFNEKVQGFEELLESRYGLDIYYSRSRKRFDIAKYFPFPSQTYDKDLSAIRQARAFILICPYPNLFSSAWVQAGWAITLNLPIFLICTHREHLAFILSAASGKENIEVIEMDFRMENGDILDYLEQNDLWRRTLIEAK